jgi:hypothetical protein
VTGAQGGVPGVGAPLVHHPVPRRRPGHGLGGAARASSASRSRPFSAVRGSHSTS